MTLAKANNRFSAMLPESAQCQSRRSGDPRYARIIHSCRKSYTDNGENGYRSPQMHSENAYEFNLISLRASLPL